MKPDRGTTASSPPISGRVAPPNQRLSVTVTPTPATLDGGFDAVLSLIAAPARSCDSAARRCLAGVDLGGRLTPETATFTNGTPTAQPQPLFVVVGSYFDSDRDTTFSLTTTLAAVLPSEVCENAPAIASGAPLTGQTLANYVRDYSLRGPRCAAAGSSGADRAYTVTVGPNQLLTVRGSPDPSADLVLNVVEGPASSCSSVGVSCLESADRGAAGVAETLTWRNTTSAARPVFIIVSRYSPGPMTFGLDVTLQ